MIQNRECTAVPQQTPELLLYLSTFAESLAADSDREALHHSILNAFLHVARPTFAALWTVEDRYLEYRLCGSLGTVSCDVPISFPASESFATILPTVSTVLWRDDTRHMNSEAQTAIGQLLEACSSNAVVSLTHNARLLGFLTLRSEHCGDRHEGTLPALLRLAAQMSASALHQGLQNDDHQHSQNLLRRTDRLRSLEVIAGGLAHEIRNPLTSIKTFVQLAPERRLDARFMEEFSRVAVDDIHRIEHLLQEILDYARYLVLTPAEENVNELVLSCVSFVSMKASDRSLRVRTQLADGLPVVLLDRQQMKQVIINLLLNAMDACPSQGQVVVRTRVGQQSADSPCVFIEVQDEGEGIAAEHLEHIFDPFFTTKHSNSTTEVRGLGLTIAHQIVREHHGAITVDSRQGAGSTFRVSLPIPAGPAAGTFRRE